ncbi:hypothetical protein G6F35_017894 [Rhizopus arrhizus]|nr:hypothetical protein G6F35_017894 [Rhizopus arrhizus]
MHMEHGSNRHADITAMQAPLGGCTAQRGHAGQRMQDQLPVAEMDALGQAGGPGGGRRAGQPRIRSRNPPAMGRRHPPAGCACADPAAARQCRPVSAGTRDGRGVPARRCG